MSKETGMGRVEVSPAVIATIASQAVSQCYGVVGLTAKNLVGELAQVLQRDAKRGVEVHIRDGQIILDLYIVVEYGTRIITVAHNVMETVKFTVEKTLGIPVAEVNVYVQGLRVSQESK